jgi:hypothetical protein
MTIASGRRLCEECRTDERQRRQRWDVDRSEGLDDRRRSRNGNDQPEYIVRKARCEERDPQPRNMLRQAERHGQSCVQHAENAAGDTRDQQAGPQVGTIIHRKPTDHGTEGHDSFDAQVQHSGTLAQQRAERPEDQGRRDAQHRGPQAGGSQYVEQGAHRRILYCAKNNATSIDKSDSATVTSAM